jgi:hypothetical protein
MLRAPLRRMSSADSTVTAAGMSDSFWALRDTAATSSLPSSSRGKSMNEVSTAPAAPPPAGRPAALQFDDDS